MIEDDPSVAQRLQEFLPRVTSPAEIALAAEEVMETLKHMVRGRFHAMRILYLPERL